MSRLLHVLLVLVAAVLAYPTWLALQIWQQSHRDEVRRAEAIVVLGAAQYDGQPSPVFRARLEHAAYLYNQDLSELVIVTGGKQAGDNHTEAEAGERYLAAENVPADRIIGEERGRTTLQSLRRVRALAAERGVDTVLLVSDPMHSERIKRMASDLGFSAAYTSPASYVELNRSRATKAKELLREVVSLVAYEVLER